MSRITCPGLPLGEGVAVHAHACGGGQLGAHAGIVQGHGVIAGLGGLGLVTEARGEAAAGLVDVAALQLDLAGGGHQQEVAQIRMPRAGEVRMREAHDGAVAVAVARRPAIAVLARLDLGIGRKLHHAEGQGGAGKGVALAAAADEGIDRIERRLLGWRQPLRGGARQRQCRQQTGQPQDADMPHQRQALGGQVSHCSWTPLR